MWLANVQGIDALNIAKAPKRRPGLAAMLRLRNEGAFLEPALASIVDWCDEVVAVVQPSTDDTRAILERFPQVRVLDYPCELAPMGPGHDRTPANSVHATAYYYNFALGQTTRAHVLKWDGDMVAMDWLGAELRRALEAGHHRIQFAGVDLVGDGRHIGTAPLCPTFGVFRPSPTSRYTQGPRAEVNPFEPAPTLTLTRPAFVHLKWCKPEASAIQQWPAGWREQPHFARIYARRLPVAEYGGEYPRALAARLEAVA